MYQVIDGGVMSDLLKGVQSVTGDGGTGAILTLRDDGWIMKKTDEAQSIMFACRVGEEGLEEYERGDFETLGIRPGIVEDAIYSKSSNVEMEMVDYDLHVRQDGYDTGLHLVDTKEIRDASQDVVDLDWCITATGDLKFLKEFYNRAETVIGATSFIIAPREGALYLYAENQGQDIVKTYPWEDFEDCNIDWDKGDSPPATGGYEPSEDHKADTVIGMELANCINFMTDKGTVHIDNHAPVKLLFDGNEGVDASYFISPRIAKESVRSTMPDDAMNERGLESYDG